MAIAYDNAVVNLSSSSATNNTSLTVSGTNRILLASIFSTVGDDLTGITATKGTVDTAMTFIKKIANGSEEVYTYGILAPDTGTVSVKASFSASVTSRLHVASYTGADQVTAIGSLVTTSSTSSGGGTGTITTPSSNCWTYLFVRGSTSVAASTGSTERPSAAGSTSAQFDSNGAIASPGSTSMIYTDSGASAWIMVAFAPTVSPLNNLALLGVG